MSIDPKKYIDIDTQDTPIIIYRDRGAITVPLDVIPSSEAQTIIPEGDVDGFAPVNVSAVTSSVDSNIRSENIKEGVSILGVNGSLKTGKYGISYDAWVGNPVNGTPSTTQGSGTPNFVGVTNMSNYWLAYKFNGNQNITGVASFPDLTRISGNNCLAGAFSGTKITSLSMPNLKTVSGPYACSYICNPCSTLTSLDFSGLESITGQEAFRNAFSYCTALTSVSFSSLKMINASYVFRYMFSNCDNLTTVSFPALEMISGASVFDNAFQNCTSLTTLSFAKLSSASDWQFAAMLVGCSNVTVHFPSAMQSTMSSWTSVQNGFSGTNTTVLFDL